MNNLPTLKGTCLLASVLLSACQTDTERQSEGREVSITFNAHVHGEPAECGVRYTDLGSSAVDAELRNLKWFVSNVELISEDGSGACAESGDEQMNAVITGVTSAPDIAGVRFEVGVPQEVNHLDLAEALPPLDRSDMFWAWQSGHKFARVEWSVGEEGSASPWNFHSLMMEMLKMDSSDWTWPEADRKL